MTGYPPDPSDTSADVQKVDEWRKDHGIANPSAFFLYGYTAAQMLIHLLQSTGGNLKRSSIAYALQNVAFTGSFKPDLAEFPPAVYNHIYRIRYLFLQSRDEAKGAFKHVRRTINLASGGG